MRIGCTVLAFELTFLKIIIFFKQFRTLRGKTTRAVLSTKKVTVTIIVIITMYMFAIISLAEMISCKKKSQFCERETRMRLQP